MLVHKLSTVLLGPEHDPPKLEAFSHGIAAVWIGQSKASVSLIHLPAGERVDRLMLQIGHRVEMASLGFEVSESLFGGEVRVILRSICLDVYFVSGLSCHGKNCTHGDSDDVVMYRRHSLRIAIAPRPTRIIHRPGMLIE